MAENISFKISAIDDFSKTMSNLESQTKQAFDSIGTIGKTMTAAGAGITAGLGMAVKTTADFEQSMSRVGALSGATEKEMESLTKTAKDLGATTSFSASQAGEGMSYLAMAGYETNEIIAAMPGLLNAAAAGQTDLATTADITSNILSGFGLEASKTADVADVLTKTFTSSNTDLNMLGETMKYVAPTANAMGLSLEEVAAAAGLLGNAGIQGSQAGTSLSMSLTRLASPSNEAAGLMAELGFNAFDAQGNLLPLNKVIENLQSSTADLTQEQRLNAISTIFGAESMKSMLTLLEAGPDTLKAYTDELSNAGGTADDIAKKQLDNLSGQLTILKSGFEAMAISIGSALMPYVKMLASGVQSLVTWFNGLSDGTKTIIATVAAIAGVFALLVGPLLILVSMIPSITAGFAALATAVGVTAGTLGVIIATITGVVAAVALIGVGLVIAYKKVEWFRDMVDEAWAYIKESFNTALQFIKGTVESVITAVTTFIRDQLDKLRKFWDENGAQIMDIVKKQIEFIKTTIKNGLEFIKGVFTAVFPIIKAIVNTVWSAIKLVISNTIDIILGVIKTGLAILRGDWKGAWESIKKTGESIMDNIINFFKNIDLFQTGKNIIQGLVNGMKNMVGAVISQVKNIAGSITNTIKSALNINSPSRLMRDDVGKQIGAGIVVGMDSMVSNVRKAAEDLATVTVPDVQTTVGAFSNGNFGGRSIGDTRGNNTTNDNRVYITVEGNIDRDLYDDIMRKQKNDIDTTLRVNGVRR